MVLLSLKNEISWFGLNLKKQLTSFERISYIQILSLHCLKFFNPILKHTKKPFFKLIFTQVESSRWDTFSKRFVHVKLYSIAKLVHNFCY